MERAVRELWAESRDLLGVHSSSPDEASAVPRADLPPTPLAFLRDHVSPGRPLLISAAATRHWPAASLWPTDSYLTDALHSTAVSLHLTPDGRADALAPHPRLPGPSKCFASPIGLHNNNFTVKYSFNKTLKVFKELKHFIFMMKKVDLCKMTKVIDEADIVFLMIKGINSKSPHIQKNKLQWSSRMTTRQRIRKLVSLGTKAGITHRLMRF
jgi:hypothetical protein